MLFKQKVGYKVSFNKWYLLKTEEEGTLPYLWNQYNPNIKARQRQTTRKEYALRTLVQRFSK